MEKETPNATQGFLTTRYGKLEFLQVFSYQYTSKLNQEKEKKIKLINWLYANKSLKLFRCTANGFETLSPMPAESTQFFFKGVKKEVAPFVDTSVFSQYLHQIFYFQLIKIYNKSGEDFIYSFIINADFKLDLCFNLNIELFEDGRFLIHFYGMSHISLANNNIQNIINIIKSMQCDDEPYFPRFQIIDKDSGRSKAIFPLSKQSLEEHDRFCQRFPNHSYSFDYEFMNRFFPVSFSGFIAKSKIKLGSIVAVLNQASSTLEKVDGINLYELPILPIKLHSVNPSMNLMVGNNKIVSKLSATYYSGLFLPISKGVILPVINCKDNTILSKIKQLINQQFNVNGNVTWLPSIDAGQIKDDIDGIIKLKKEYPTMFVMIFTDVVLAAALIQKLRYNIIKYQIMQLPADVHRLSNFGVKCLHKMGAKIALIKDLGLKKDGFVVGIDMGHFQGNKLEPGFSNLVMVFFTSHGEHIYTSKVEGIPLNEALQYEDLKIAFNKFKNHLIQSKRNLPAQLIFHRDGRLHKDDYTHLSKSVHDVFNISDSEVVEVIKSGHPYVYTQSNQKIQNAASGQYWYVKDKDYALLITNDQVTSQGEALKPIVIKRKHGNIPFETIVSQVYWFCKLYTNNIYYPSRLPATTELANNRASTGLKEYRASYRKN